jgi:hypothetical protein
MAIHIGDLQLRGQLSIEQLVEIIHAARTINNEHVVINVAGIPDSACFGDGKRVIEGDDEIIIANGRLLGRLQHEYIEIFQFGRVKERGGFPANAYFKLIAFQTPHRPIPIVTDREVGDHRAGIIIETRITGLNGRWCNQFHGGVNTMEIEEDIGLFRQARQNYPHAISTVV